MINCIPLDAVELVIVRRVHNWILDFKFFPRLPNLTTKTTSITFTPPAHKKIGKTMSNYLKRLPHDHKHRPDSCQNHVTISTRNLER